MLAPRPQPLGYNCPMADSTSKELLGAYLVVGDDTLKARRVVERLRARMESYGDPAFNTDVFDGESATGEAIVMACGTLPFASEKRLVHVTHADSLKKADSEPVVAYLASPASTTVLLLEAEKLAKSTRLYKAVAKLGKSAVIDCSLPKAYELPKQVEAMAGRYGLKLGKAAAEKLVELVGTDTVHLDSSLQRLSLERGAGATLSAADVEGAVARTASAKPWEFTDAFARRDVAGCLRLLGRLGDSSSFALLTMACNRIRELLAAQSIAGRRDGTTLGQALGMPDWRVKNHGAWARNFSPRELTAALSSARDAEQKMKSGGDADEVFQDWLLATLRRG